MIGSTFRQKYFARYGSHPGNSQAGLAYDRICLLLGSWQRTGHPGAFEKVIGDLRTSIKLLRGLISAVRMAPEPNTSGGQGIELVGDLAGIMNLRRRI